MANRELLTDLVGIKLDQGFTLLSALPLDVRSISNSTLRTNLKNANAVYDGLLTYDSSDDKFYYYKNATGWTELKTGGSEPTDYYWADIQVQDKSDTTKVPTFGGASVQGNLELGDMKQNAVTKVGGIHVWDTRNLTHKAYDLVGSNKSGVNWYFHMIDNIWYGIMHVKGWGNDNYAAWELAGNANSNTDAIHLKVRTGIKSEWTDWKEIALTEDLPVMFTAEEIAGIFDATIIEW